MGLWHRQPVPALKVNLDGNGKSIDSPWAAVDGATHYHFNYTLHDGTDWFRYASDIPGTTTTLAMTGLQETKGYTLAVQSVAKYQSNNVTKTLAHGRKNSDMVHAPPRKPTGVLADKFRSVSSPRVRVSCTVPTFRGTGPDSAAEKISYNIYCRATAAPVGTKWHPT